MTKRLVTMEARLCYATTYGIGSENRRHYKTDIVKAKMALKIKRVLRILGIYICRYIMLTSRKLIRRGDMRRAL